MHARAEDPAAMGGRRRAAAGAALEHSADERRQVRSQEPHQRLSGALVGRRKMGPPHPRRCQPAWQAQRQRLAPAAAPAPAAAAPPAPGPPARAPAWAPAGWAAAPAAPAAGRAALRVPRWRVLQTLGLPRVRGLGRLLQTLLATALLIRLGKLQNAAEPLAAQRQRQQGKPPPAPAAGRQAEPAAVPLAVLPERLETARLGQVQLSLQGWHNAAAGPQPGCQGAAGCAARTAAGAAVLRMLAGAGAGAAPWQQPAAAWHRLAAAAAAAHSDGAAWPGWSRRAPLTVLQASCAGMLAALPGARWAARPLAGFRPLPLPQSSLARKRLPEVGPQSCCRAVLHPLLGCRLPGCHGVWCRPVHGTSGWVGRRRAERRRPSWVGAAVAAPAAQAKAGGRLPALRLQTRCPGWECAAAAMLRCGRAGAAGFRRR